MKLKCLTIGLLLAIINIMSFKIVSTIFNMSFIDFVGFMLSNNFKILVNYKKGKS